MAGELKIASTVSGLSTYGLIFSPSGTIWNGATFETYQSANYATYDVPLTEQGSSAVYIGSMPVLLTTPGVYEVFYYQQAGGSAAEGDPLLGSGAISWGSPSTTTVSTTPGAGMTLATMEEEISDRVTVYDYTVASDAKKLKRWLNMAQQEITGRQNWPFMVAHEIVQTVVDVTTGTVSIAAGGTLLTFSSPPVLSMTDRFIKFGTDSNWYRITSHTATAATATISPAYMGTADLVDGAYTMRKLFYSTSTPLDSILDIKKMSPGRFLESANARDTDVFLPLYWDQGSVYKYISSIPDSTGALRFSLLYSPGTVENLQVRGIKRLADMSETTDTSIIPVRWQSALLDLATFYAFSSVDDSRAADFFNKAERTIQAMAETYAPDLGRQRVSRSLNTGILEGPAYVLPPQYGVNQA